MLHRKQRVVQTQHSESETTSSDPELSPIEPGQETSSERATPEPQQEPIEVREEEEPEYNHREEQEQGRRQETERANQIIPKSTKGNRECKSGR